MFTTYLGLSKRKEHGLETWALFIDLVKAFDSVPRDALFAVLRRYGMPDHFVKVLIRLHYGAKVKVNIGDVDSEINSTPRLLRRPCTLSLYHAGGNGDIGLAGGRIKARVYDT